MTRPMTRPKVLLLVGGPAYHDNPEIHRPLLSALLNRPGRYDLTMTDDLGVLTTGSLAEYGVIVNSTTFLDPTDEQVSALLSAVESGKGFVGIHGATATFWGSAPYLRMIGSRFIRHDPFKAFTVDVEDSGHPITAGVGTFQVEDELYEQGGKVEDFDEFAAAYAEVRRSGRPLGEVALGPLGDGPLAADCHVLASAEGHPLLYVKAFGKGKVHYNALGHDQRAIQNPAFERLVLQAIDWAMPG